jgi:hypothetical protein
MDIRSGHRIERILLQLSWIQRRQHRIIDSVMAHFGRAAVKSIVDSLKLRAQELPTTPDYSLLLDDAEPLEFVNKLAYSVEFDEALIIKELLLKASPYPNHVKEQILFGARNAGQDAGRFVLQKDLQRKFSLIELFQAVDSIYFQETPGEHNYFVSLRPMGSVSIHNERCRHIDAWNSAGADPIFMEQIQSLWIQGVVDILATNVHFQRTHSIPRGDEFGLWHFIPRDKHVEL